MNERYIEKMRNHLNGESIGVKYNVLKNDAGHTDEEIKVICPEIKMFSDLYFIPHRYVTGGVQSKLDFDNGRFISVVGGGEGSGLYGDGKTTFEVGWLDEDGNFEVDGHLSIDEVTQKMVEVQSKPTVN